MRRALVFLLFMVLPVFGMAATIHVPGDQPTIQAGIDAATDGDTVLVAPDTYVENINFLGKAITVTSELGPEVTIIDGSSPEDPDFGSVVTFWNDEGRDSILEGFTLTGGSGNYMSEGDQYFGGGISVAGSSPAVTGNIITGNTVTGSGGGIDCFDPGSPLIADNTISENHAEGGYGGVRIKKSDAIVRKNTISRNTSVVGPGGIGVHNAIAIIADNTVSDNSALNGGYGGISVFNAFAVIADNTVSGNQASFGGGIYVIGDSTGYPPTTLTGNVVANNNADTDGGGIYLFGTTTAVLNNLVIGNNAISGRGAGIWVTANSDVLIANTTVTGNTANNSGGGIGATNSTITVVDSILWGNSAAAGKEMYLMLSSTATISYCDVDGGQGSVRIRPGCTLDWGTGMIDADPLFEGEGDEAFCLSQIAAGQATDSPCVDTGDPASEMIWGATRSDSVQDAGIIDMGYHYPGLERLVVGPGPAYNNPPLVRVVYPQQDAGYEYEFSAYGPTHYGVNVTCGDVNGDDIDEIITGAGPGDIYGPHVRGFYVDSTPLTGLSFFAYGTLRYGVNVAAGDLDADGFDEIITGAGPGAVFGPHVRGWNYDGSGTVTSIPGVSYFAYGTPKWGVNVSAGDIDGDGYDEIVTGAGPGAVYGPHVRGWNVDGGAATSIPGVSFFAYGTLKYGVNVTCGDVDGDGIDEIITGPGPGAVFAPHVRGWNYDGSSVTPLPGLSFFAWPAEDIRYGANVFAGVDLDGDGRDEIVVGCGPDPDPDVGTPVKVFRYRDTGVAEWFSLEAFPGMTQGANVAAGRF